MKFSRLVAAAVIAAVLASPAMAGDKRKLAVAAEGAYPPFNYVGADGSLQGFDIDFAKALCEKLNADCSFVKQDWDDMIPGLIDKKYDMIVSSMSILPERQEKVDFSIPYHQLPAALVVTRKSGVKVAADGTADGDSLSGLKIGVLRDSTFESYARDKWPQANIRSYDTPESADADMIAGQLDGRFDDYVRLKSGLMRAEQASNYQQVGRIVSERDLGSNGQGVAVRKGEGELRDAISKAIEDMQKDGTYIQLNDRYFDFDIYGG